MSKKKKPE